MDINMDIKQEIKDLQSRITILKQQLFDDSSYDWDNAPIITTIDGIEYRLGPESPNRLTWDEAIDWCESVGGELPSREVLLICFINETIRANFKRDYYWSSTEYATNTASTEWVRAVRKFAIS